MEKLRKFGYLLVFCIVICLPNSVLAQLTLGTSFGHELQMNPEPAFQSRQTSLAVIGGYALTPQVIGELSLLYIVDPIRKTGQTNDLEMRLGIKISPRSLNWYGKLHLIFPHILAAYDGAGKEDDSFLGGEKQTTVGFGIGHTFTFSGIPFFIEAGAHLRREPSFQNPNQQIEFSTNLADTTATTTDDATTGDTETADAATTTNTAETTSLTLVPNKLRSYWFTEFRIGANFDISLGDED
ncbi:MAG: hypothetical protein VYA34_16695 [Myxococcota bacterium]|nr:hypothetical protein [Myxococcota bacterium]